MKLIGFPLKKPTQYNAIHEGSPVFTIIKQFNKETGKEEWKLTNIQTLLNETQTKQIYQILKKLNEGEEIECQLSKL